MKIFIILSIAFFSFLGCTHVTPLENNQYLIKTDPSSGFLCGMAMTEGMTLEECEREDWNSLYKKAEKICPGHWVIDRETKNNIWYSIRILVIECPKE